MTVHRARAEESYRLTLLEQSYSTVLKKYRIGDIKPHTVSLDADIRAVLKAANEFNKQTSNSEKININSFLIGHDEGNQESDYIAKIINLIHLPSGFKISGTPKNLQVGEEYTRIVKDFGKNKLSWTYESAFENNSSLVSKKIPKNGILIEKIGIKRNGMQVLSVWSFTSQTGGKKMFIKIQAYDHKKMKYCTVIVSAEKTITQYSKGKIKNINDDKDSESLLPNEINFLATLNNIMKLISGNVPDDFQFENSDIAKLFVTASAV